MAKKRKGNPVTGWLVVDKPQGISSNAVVGKARWAFEAQKVGHAGTLDPMATGILPLAFGEATKTIPFLMDADKAYRFTVTWGTATDTLDAEGQVTETGGRSPDRGEIDAVLGQFVGDIEQMPPAFSALKVDGKRAYALARAGEEVTLTPRTVRIDRLLCTSAETTTASFEVACGKGTYVRALARDIAAALGTLGHVSVLRRTKVGRFEEKDAISFDKLESFRHNSAAEAALLGIATVLDDIPALAVTPDEARRLRHGQAIAPNPAARDGLQLTSAPNSPILATLDGVAVALLESEADQLRPVRVFGSG